MGKDYYILNVINKIKDILEKNEYRKKRYDSDLLWFDKRAHMIRKNIIRIAIMGITSSGKSTLVNAILGEKILPVAIKPSSSIIITCSKGEKRQATIYFRDREPEILIGESLNEKVIEDYADESKNPNNELKVTQIDITTPSFLLDEDIHIIDSPGLDACDLEMHEKLTLEILLPTIDICIFLTTVKANSDEVNVEKIRIVNKKGKQIVLVQNMIDSVEDKFGKNGIVEEDKATILSKHKKRAENLLIAGTSRTIAENSLKSTNRRGKVEENLISGEFEVIQISALNALKGIIEKNDNLYNRSNIKEFIKAIETCIERVIPKINDQRGISISERIDHIITTDREIIEGSDIEYINSLMSITSGDIDDLVSDFSMAREKISLKIKEIDKNVRETINEINNSESENIENYLSIIEKINNKNIHMENEIVGIVKECEEKKIELYKNLNLDTRFNYSLPSMNSKYIDIKHKYEERTKLIEKDGILNKGKRILSQIFDTQWGYEKEEYDEKVVDKDATIFMVQNICNQNRRKYMNVLWDWSAQYNKSLNVLYIEVMKRTDEYEKKKDQKIEINDIEDVILNLKAINNKFKMLKNYKNDEVSIDKLNYTSKGVSHSEINKKNTQDINKTSEEVSYNADTATYEKVNKSNVLTQYKRLLKKKNNNEFENDNLKQHEKYVVSNMQYNLYKLSNEVLEKNYLLVGNYIREKSLEKLGSENEQIFWTWDVDSCVVFISRICGIYLGKTECEMIKKEGMYKINNITIVYELCEKKLNLYMILKEVKKKSYNIFVIFNGIQIGNSEKQVLESFVLKQFINDNITIISLVIDSSKEFIHANNIKELLFSVIKFKNKIINKFNGVKDGYVLINSKNPIYNMALIEAQEKDKFIISDYRDIKESLFKNLLSRGLEEKATIGEILDYFLNKVH